MTRLGEAAKVSPVTTSTHLSGRPPTGAGQGGVWRREEEEKLRTVPLSFTEIRQRGSHPAHPHPHRQCVSVRSWRRRRAPAFFCASAADPSRSSPRRIAQDDASFSREAHQVTRTFRNMRCHWAPLALCFILPPMTGKEKANHACRRVFNINFVYIRRCRF